jgi:WD40 repeat protein
MAASGLRNQVMLAGDDDRQVRQALASLVNGHLVRAEQRRGVTWYELAHDRLIEPVRTDNREWRLANLSLLQRQAVLWDEGRRDGGLLLMGAAYSEAEEWAKRHPDELERLEQEFLTACRQLALRRRTEQILFGVVTVLMVLAIITAGVAYAYSQQAEAAKRDALLAQQSAVSNFQRAETARQRAEAETARAEAETARAETERQRAEQERLRAESQLQVAQARQLAAEGRSALDNGDTQLALLLGIVAQSVVTETAQGETLLRAALHSWRGDTVLPSHSAALSQIAFSPDNQLLLTGGDDGVVVVRTQSDLTVQYTLTHAGRIAGMVFTPDGTRLATGSRDGTVRLWNVPTGEAVATLRHPGEVRSLQLGPDQITLAARSDNRIYLYDIRTGEAIAPSQPLVAGDALRAFEFHPGGGLAVASVNNRTLQLWSLVDGRQRNMGGFSAVIDALRFSRDGRWLVGRAGNRLLLFAVTLTDDGAPNLSAIFDTESDAGFLRTPLAESNSVTAYQGFALSNDSQRLAAGSADGSLRIWLLPKPGDSPLRLRGHTEQVSGVAFSPDGRMLATTSLDNSVIFWRVSDGEMIETLRTGAEVQQAPAFGRDNRRLYTGDNQGNLYVWQVAPGDVPGYAALHLRPARALAQAGEWLAAAGSDGLVELWNSASGERTAFDAGADRIDALAIAANGRLIATGSATGEIFLFDPTSGREVARWPAHRNGVRALRFLPTGGLVSAGGEPEIRLWDETGAPAGTLNGHSSDVNALALSSDGALLFSASADGSVRRWRLVDGGQEAVYQTSTPLLAVAVSNDGDWLAAGGFGFNGAEAGRLPVTVWRVAEPTLSVRRLIHPRVVRSVTFLPDGRLVTADEEGDLNLWSLVTGERVSWRAHGPGWTTAVAADPAGRLIYSLGNDSLLRAWYATSSDLVTAACGQIDTRLTNEEWAELLPGSAPQPLCQQPAPLPTLTGSPLPPNLPAALQPPAGRPLIDWFDAPTGSILTPGRPTYLRWSIEQATAVYLQKDEGEPEGQIGRNTLRISEPGRYRLRVQSEAGEWVEEIVIR